MTGKPIPFASGYTITRSGAVFKDGEAIAINKTQFGGKKCEIDGKTYLVHRLVASVYLGLNIKDNDAFVQHKDDNQQNNSVSNLSIGTNSSNTQDKVDKDRQHRPEGADNSQSKLSASNVQAIKKANKSGVKNVDLAKRYDISEAQVSRIVNGKRW